MFLASAYMHDPSTPVLLGNWGLKYSDVVYGVFYPIYERSERWFKPEDFYAFRFNYMSAECPKPYVNYRFEYPPVIGALWYASTCIGFHTARLSLREANYKEFLDYTARVHYYVQAAFIGIFYFTLIHYLSRLVPSRRRLLLFLVLPSLAMYLVYNWDVIASCFAVIGLYEYLRKRYFRSGLFMGLSIATKVLTIGLATWLFVELLLEDDRRSTTRYILGAGLVLAVFFAPLALFAQEGLIAFIQHHATWYCENCFTMVFVRDIHSEQHKYAYLGFLLLTWLFLLQTRVRATREAEKLYWVLSLYSLIVFNYVFSPQMMLMLSPVSVLVLDAVLLKLYAIADVFNAAIIALFFLDSEVRRLLGLQPKFNPWTLDSPVQWFAMARNIALVLIMIYLGLTIVLRHVEDHGKV
ncbi:MAG: hypothetical protein QW081_00670 [Desulfurococcaceae archaeon]